MKPSLRAVTGHPLPKHQVRALLALRPRRRWLPRLPHRLPPLRRRPRRHPLRPLRAARKHQRRSGMTTAYETALATPQQRAATARTRITLLSIAAAVILLDRGTKLLVSRHLDMGEAHVVIPHVFRITHVLNTGAAFSAFADTANPETVRLALIAFSIAAVLVVGIMLWRSAASITLSGVALALILGGASRQPLRPHPPPPRHRLPRSPHRPLPLAGLQHRRLRHRRRRLPPPPRNLPTPTEHQPS